MKKNNIDNNIVLVGGGVMSLTLAVLINEIYPEIQIDIIERLPSCGLESSDALNNAGTGHAGYCELNYTPINKKNQRGFKIFINFQRFIYIDLIIFIDGCVV